MTVAYMSIVAPSFQFAFITALGFLSHTRPRSGASKVNSSRSHLMCLGAIWLSFLTGFSQAATPVAWFKAGAITGINSGGTLFVWGDSSGSGFNATQANPGQQPTFVANAMNGLPVVRFNSANSTVLAFSRPVQDDFTIICVFQSTQGLGSGTLFYPGAGQVNGEVAGGMDDFGPCLFANGTIRMN